MSPRSRDALLALYSRQWRHRHGAEFGDLLTTNPLSFRVLGDVLRHAAGVRVQEHPRMSRTVAAVLLFAVLDVTSVRAGVTVNLLWAPTTPYRAFALALTVAPLLTLSAWLLGTTRSSRRRPES